MKIIQHIEYTKQLYEKQIDLLLMNKLCLLSNVSNFISIRILAEASAHYLKNVINSWTGNE